MKQFHIQASRAKEPKLVHIPTVFQDPCWQAFEERLGKRKANFKCRPATFFCNGSPLVPKQSKLLLKHLGYYNVTLIWSKSKHFPVCTSDFVMCQLPGSPPVLARFITCTTVSSPPCTCSFRSSKNPWSHMQ
jgi:hypothetical protein